MKNKKELNAVSKNTGTGLENLEAQALFQLKSGHYKEAITLYKDLLQTSDKDNDKWAQQIAYCYLQRALSFADRGMYKEALVLWESHCQFAQAPFQAYDHYISWQLQTNNQDKIKSCLSQLSAEQLDKQYPKLASLLGLFVITEHPEYQQDLPQDSIFIAHCKIAQTALQAFHENDHEKLKESLKQLPYRSAFKDLRTLLKAVISFHENIEQTHTLLAKIPTHSAYSQIASLILACTRNGTELISDLQRLNYKQCKIIAEIKDLNNKQLKFIDDLNKQKDHLSDKIKFNLAIDNKSLCGSEFTQQFCHALLATYPAGQRKFKKNFKSIDTFEENRLLALICESANKGYDADYHWKQCLAILVESKTDNSYKIALILRHIATQQEEAENKIELLIKSLKYDPEDRETYLQILRYYCQQQETEKDYKQWLNQTLEKFPQDIDILIQAIRTASHKKAHKKASQYALKILKIDPLNVFAKQTLFSNHLAHARKLILGMRYHLVENEIQQAADLNLGKSNTQQTELMRGLFYFVAQDKKHGLKLIVQSLSKLNSDPVNTQFQGTMEALLTDLPVATIIRELPVSNGYLLSAQDLTQLIDQIKQYTLEESDNQHFLHKALDKIKPALKKSLLEQDYDENLMLTFCQTIDKANYFELLRHCAKIALAKWNKPIWVYYQVYSDTNGIPERCNFTNIVKLQQNQQQAMHNKDHRALVLIDDFLDHYYQVHPHQAMDFLDDLFNIDDDDKEEDVFEDPIEALFYHIPEKVLNKINKKSQSLTKKTSPEYLAQQLTEVFGPDSNILFAMMEQPDLFTALMVVKAAEMSNIDIDVNYDDVLSYFGVSRNNGSIPF